jgi:hypothetical protein
MPSRTCRASSAPTWTRWVMVRRARPCCSAHRASSSRGYASPGSARNTSSSTETPGAGRRSWSGSAGFAFGRRCASRRSPGGRWRCAGRAPTTSSGRVRRTRRGGCQGLRRCPGPRRRPGSRVARARPVRLCPGGSPRAGRALRAGTCSGRIPSPRPGSAARATRSPRRFVWSRGCRAGEPSSTSGSSPPRRASSRTPSVSRRAATPARSSWPGSTRVAAASPATSQGSSCRPWPARTQRPSPVSPSGGVSARSVW